ncbi:preprotein translocase subunit SecE [Candidatus Erwinia haradaeae]|uniref:Protein translocase subunit SecE n=1 Tax=Candidatus Erwinia haradaeae TaxID=1922217 RepID=A0A803FUM3_9GAMM|nr:preprotein translocase subunit SecE [Candidatus Erwinia haradaeae]VFP88303.1 Protein translocase subunit SecE [Candidatus Erwinia haradaeae]
MSTCITRAQKKRRWLEIGKWLSIIFFFLIAIIGNVWFSNVTVSLRIFAIILLLTIAVGIFRLTEKGKITIVYINQTYKEIRKIIWPSRQETFNTTLIVSAATAAMSLILWGLDNLLVRIISFITGLRF